MMINGGMPIPGENFTSDTKNYAWHRPPEHKSVSDAIDKMMVKMTDSKVAHGMMTLAEAGIPLIRISQMICMEGLAQGKWTMDMALLLAGPFTKILEIMCDSFDIEYDIGIEEDDSFNTGTFFKGVSEMDKAIKNNKVIKIVAPQMDAIKAEAEGQDPGAPVEGAEGEAPAPETEPDIQAEGFTSMMGAPPPEDGSEENVPDTEKDIK